MNRKKQVPAEAEYIGELVEFVSQSLQDYGIKKKECAKAALITEEAAASIIAHCPNDGGQITAVLKAFAGNVAVELSAKGEKYALKGSSLSISAAYEDDEAAIGESIRNILLGSLADSLKYVHKDGINYIRMTLVRSRRAFLYQTLGAMVLAIVLGMLCSSFMPAQLNAFMNDTIFVSVKTMYMNALKMIVAPVVFFSIVSCIVRFSDLSELGRIGLKIIGMYLFTTVVAVGIGIGISFLLQPGDPSMAASLVGDASSVTSQTIDVSVKDTIVGIIPSDIITPFMKANMLQIIFMAVLCGVATGLLGKYSDMLAHLFNACNDLFLKIATLIIKAMPLAVFCSIMSMMLTLGVHTIISVFGMFGTFIAGLSCMMVFYCLMMSIIARLNPQPFVRKYAPYMLQVFSMASSNASIPINMEACEKKIGINKKIFSLAIPLGATLNMDGTCIYLAVFSLALAKTYGIEITGSVMVSIIISIIILSMGAPGIPGSGLICLSVILTQMNVPLEAVGLVMGIDSFCGMFRSMSNCLGDVAVATIVAKSENEMDMKIYGGK